MSELAAVSGCEVTCPVAAGRVLTELAAQLTPPHEWLMAQPGDPLEGISPFSTDAVRTVANNYYVAGDPSSPRYGHPREVLTSDGIEQMMIGRGLRTGSRHLRPDEVAELHRLGAVRNAARDKFAEQPADRLRRVAAAARPMLDEVDLSLRERDPDFAELRGLAATLAAREEEVDETVKFARDLTEITSGFDRLYALDQGPFALATLALQNCGGPWVYMRPRYYFFGRLEGKPVETTICPNGKRGPEYFGGEEANEASKRPLPPTLR